MSEPITNTPPLVLAPSRHARALARAIADAIGGQVCIAPKSPAAALRDAFASGRPIVAICAVGIVARALAPLLTNKRAEPPVVAVSTDGKHVVAVLGGHSGANVLARKLASVTGGEAAVTTASEAAFGLALDEPPPGWRLANPEHAKPFVSALLNGARVRIEGEAPSWLSRSALPLLGDDENGSALRISCTERALAGAPDHLVYHPRRLVLGVGMARNAPAEELIALVERTLAEAGLAPGAVAAIGTIACKADEPALSALAAHLNAPPRLFAPQELKAIAVPNPSERVAAEVGTPSVAEAAALALAGPGGALLVEKRKSAAATCALARVPRVIDDAARLPGRARGLLFVVGLGPGAPRMRTTQAREALLSASDWVGYSLYLDLAREGADLAAGKRLHPFALGEEEERVRHAIRLAAEGRRVALLCSGDAAVYAMASLVFELLYRKEENWDDFARHLRVEVVPGITALQAASAGAGALIGHDFCAISLSDLMTPWEVIERRLRAAAEADFVTALYNPRSRRRTEQLARALAIFRAHRPPETPVVFAASVGRAREKIRVVPLAEARAEWADMLSVVLIGNSESRIIAGGEHGLAFTPRGYGEKSRREASSDPDHDEPPGEPA